MTYSKELRKRWMQNPKFRSEYEALGTEFEVMAALTHARLESGLTQSQIAERMKTTQSAVARLEGGRSNPSMRTLERYAQATGTRVRITFEPVGQDRQQSTRAASPSSIATDHETIEEDAKRPESLAA